MSCFVPVPKPSNPNELRITLDSRVINQAIERERHNMPTVENLMVELNNAKIMSKLDLKSGYHQIGIHPHSRFITVFMTPRELMRYKRLVMGICCASEMFQRGIEQPLNGLKCCKIIKKKGKLFTFGHKNFPKWRRGTLKLKKKLWRSYWLAKGLDCTWLGASLLF